MIDCIAIGDSIAVGVGEALHCQIRAKVGLPSSKIIRLADGSYHEVCIISAGSNDPYNPNLSKNLKTIRNKTHCKYVVWMLPVNNHARAVVDRTGLVHNDKRLTFQSGSDKIHPRNYNEIGKEIGKLYHQT